MTNRYNHVYRRTRYFVTDPDTSKREALDELENEFKKIKAMLTINEKKVFGRESEGKACRPLC